MVFAVRSRPLRTVLRWQIIATGILAAIAGVIWEIHGAVSAALGGMVNVAAGWAFGWIATRKQSASSGEALRTMFRAEGVKILLVIILSFLVWSLYRQIVVPAFLAAFVVTVVVSTMAIAVKDT